MEWIKRDHIRHWNNIPVPKTFYYICCTMNTFSIIVIMIRVVTSPRIGHVDSKEPRDMDAGNLTQVFYKSIKCS